MTQLQSVPVPAASADPARLQSLVGDLLRRPAAAARVPPRPASAMRPAFRSTCAWARSRRSNTTAIRAWA